MVAWIVFTLWSVAAVGFVAQWWLMKDAHERVRVTLQSGRASSGEGIGEAPAKRANTGMKTTLEPRGTPGSELVGIGLVLAGDPEATREFDRVLQEIAEWNDGIMSSNVNGALIFRHLLLRRGEDVPETMTEVEAAALFLRKAERFSEVLARWQAALEQRPWNLSDQTSSRGMHLVLNWASTTFGRLMGAMVEANWRLGDIESAWTWLDRIRVASEVPMEKPGIGALQEHTEGWTIFSNAFHRGLKWGVFSDAQLASIPTLLGRESGFELMQRALDGQRDRHSADFSRYREDKASLTMTYFAPGAILSNTANQIAVSLITDRQLDDNLALLHHRIDRTLSQFDPQTGIYRPTATRPDEVEFGSSAGWFDRFYLMPSNRWLESSAYASIAEEAIRHQTSTDQMRLAAALELHRRATGQYPDALDSVGAHFPDGLPLDLATGEPYGYRRQAEEGYRLWGRGLDQVDDGGTTRKDISWILEPDQ